MSDQLGLWLAWAPALESEAEAYTLRTTGPEAAAAYVHAAAAAAGAIPRDTETIVCARDAQTKDAPLLCFAVRLSGADTVARLLSPEEGSSYVRQTNGGKLAV